MANTEPFVTVACICEKALQERDSALSLIRIVDIFNFQLPESMPGGEPVVEFTVVVVLKSGSIEGKTEMWLSIRYPSGRTTDLIERQPIVLKGGEHGFSVVTHVFLKVEEVGLFWCDVIWEGKTLTSIPFRLQPKEEQSQSSSSI